MSAIEDRIKELTELSKANYPDLPDWYITMCVEAYVRLNEPELVAEALSLNENNTSTNGKDETTTASISIRECS